MEAGFELLVEEVCIQSMTVTMGTDGKGVGLLLQLRDSSGVPHMFQTYVPYEAPGGVDTKLEENFNELTDCFLRGIYMDIWMDASGKELDGGLRFMLHGAGRLADLYGPCWQRIN